MPVTTVKCVTLPDGGNVTQFSEFELFSTKFREGDDSKPRSAAEYHQMLETVSGRRLPIRTWPL